MIFPFPPWTWRVLVVTGIYPAVDVWSSPPPVLESQSRRNYCVCSSASYNTNMAGGSYKESSNVDTTLQIISF